MKTNNPEILNKFLNYLLVIKGYSKYTIKSYNSDLLLFFKFIKEYMKIPREIEEFNQFILLQVKESDIIAFLVYCNYSRDNNPYTRQRKLSAIRMFYKWLLSTIPGGYTKENPAKEIGNIQKVVRLPKYLTLSQAQKIQTIFTLENTKFPLRNNTIISLFLSTGMRVGELINVNLNDINFTNSCIYIHGKGAKERTVYLNKNCKKQLQKYIQYRNNKYKVVDLKAPLFMSYQNKRISIDAIEDICKKAYDLMGLADMHYNVHTLRHTAASLIYTYVKSDILILKEFLGHSRISTTEIYTHIHNEKVKEVVNKNPLNNIKIS